MLPTDNQFLDLDLLEKVAVARWKEEFLNLSRAAQNRLLKSKIMLSPKDYSKKLSQTATKIMQDSADKVNAELIDLSRERTLFGRVINKILRMMHGGSIIKTDKDTLIKLINKKKFLKKLPGANEFINRLSNLSRNDLIVYSGPTGERGLKDSILKMHEAFETKGIVEKALGKAKKFVPTEEFKVKYPHVYESLPAEERAYTFVKGFTPSELVDFERKHFSIPISEKGLLAKAFGKTVSGVLYPVQKILERLEDKGKISRVVARRIGTHMHSDVLRKERNLIKNLKRLYPDEKYYSIEKLRKAVGETPEKLRPMLLGEIIDPLDAIFPHIAYATEMSERASRALKRMGM
ncbi:MAG: hypothetical protein QXQ43_03370 [Nitrososphaerota archaeon]